MQAMYKSRNDTPNTVRTTEYTLHAVYYSHFLRVQVTVSRGHCGRGLGLQVLTVTETVN